MDDGTEHTASQSDQHSGADPLAPPPEGQGGLLTYNSPLSEARARSLITTAVTHHPRTVVDLGCGWGRLLVDVLAAAPGATGVGIDVHGPDLERGRTLAERSGVADRVTFVTGEAEPYRDAADLVINIGAFQAYRTPAQALGALRELVNPGGRLIFGAEFWEHPPTDAELAHLWEGTTAEDCTDLAGLVDLAVAAGFRPVRTETVTRTEWEEYESGHMAERELWLAAHPGHPQADEVRSALDSQRSIWLRGHRDLLGFAYLTLVGDEARTGGRA
ncbi:MAG: class I SAM-dependent methyltransferase [Propionibacteriales bacterium]|nr:class I SAM-dependent methyltransferase [Propionibacteriales bacterium]